MSSITEKFGDQTITFDPETERVVPDPDREGKFTVVKKNTGLVTRTVSKTGQTFTYDPATHILVWSNPEKTSAMVVPKTSIPILDTELGIVFT